MNESLLSITSFPWLISFSVLIIVFVYAVYRAGSWHFVLSRMWRLISGKKYIYDRGLARRWERVEDVEYIRFQTGIKFKDMGEIEETFDFIEREGISIGDLIRARAYYIIDERRVRNPHAKAKAICFLLVVALLAYPLYLSLDLVGGREALLKIKDGGQRFWSDGSVAYFWGEKDDSYDQKRCESRKEKDKEVQVLCQTLDNDPETKDFLDSAIRGQRIGGAALLFSIVLGMAMNARWAGRAGMAHSIRKKLESGEHGNKKCS